MFNKVILIGRLGQNAEAKTTQNNNEFVVLNSSPSSGGPAGHKVSIAPQT